MLMMTGSFPQRLEVGPMRSMAVVSLYAKLFSTGMKNKWHERVYIDMYAGAGYAKVRETSRFIAGSPIQALLLPDPFDKYIFCEADSTCLNALRVRVRRTAPSAKVAFVEGDCNQRIEEILAEIPAHSTNHRVLTLCFVDPYDIGVKFATLHHLSVKFIDFLVLLAIYMDAARNQENYVREEAIKIDEFLGQKDWRQRWKLEQTTGCAVPKILSERVLSKYGEFAVQTTAFLQDQELAFVSPSIVLPGLSGLWLLG